MMTKEVTFTTVKSAKIEVKDGKPVTVENPELTVLGNLSEKNAQKKVVKMYGFGTTMYACETVTKVYEMEVEDFIKYAKERTLEA